MKTFPRRETLWRKRSLALKKAWANVDESDEALHQARVASRRIREVLPLFAGGRPGRLQKLRKRVRRITRALGPVRELDVELKALAELVECYPSARIGIEFVREQILSDRQAARDAMVKRVDAIDIDKLDRRISTWLTETRPDPPTTDPAAWRAILAARVSRRTEALRTAVGRAGGLYLPDRLHAVRVAVKKLRYVLELVQESRIARSTRPIKRLKAVQDNLGRLHDLEVLTERARNAQTSVESRSRRPIVEIDRVIRLLEDECRRLHAAYVGSRDDLDLICDVTVPEIKRALAVDRPRPARMLSLRLRTPAARRTTAADRGPSLPMRGLTSGDHGGDG